MSDWRRWAWRWACRTLYRAEFNKLQAAFPRAFWQNQWGAYPFVIHPVGYVLSPWRRKCRFVVGLGHKCRFVIGSRG